MSDDERARRMSDRRNRARSKASEPDEQAEQSKSSEPSKPDKTSEPDESNETSVKDEYEGTYMYLPEEQKSEINLAFKRANLEYEEETGEELEKNRHFYPLLIKEGLDGLDGLDGKAIKDCLDELDV